MEGKDGDSCPTGFVIEMKLTGRWAFRIRMSVNGNGKRK